MYERIFDAFDRLDDAFSLGVSFYEGKFDKSMEIPINDEVAMAKIRACMHTAAIEASPLVHSLAERWYFAEPRTSWGYVLLVLTTTDTVYFVVMIRVLGATVCLILRYNA